MARPVECLSQLLLQIEVESRLRMHLREGHEGVVIIVIIVTSFRWLRRLDLFTGELGFS